MSNVQTDPVPIHPVQTHYRPGARAYAPQVVTMRAYEVYSHCFGEQQAMITDGCRGGFGVGELIAFLYARSFPKAEWRERVNDALRGQANL